jgi:DNA-directed RNA polymerase subunit RPC12/RpoP
MSNLALAIIDERSHMMKANVRLLGFVVLAFGACQAQPHQAVVQRSDTVYVLSRSQFDSLSGQLRQLTQFNSLSEQYAAVLEKTNNQLSLWWNPYGVFVAMIGVLLTLLAIVVTFIIFRQSAGYRRTINEAIANYRGVIDKFIEEKKADLDIRIKDTEAKIADATEDQRKQLESELTEFRKVREALTKSAASVPTIPAGSTAPYFWPSGSVFSAPPSGSVIGIPVISVTWDKSVKCSNCQKEFGVHHPSSDLVVPSGSVIAKCPYCGHSNTVTF